MNAVARVRPRLRCAPCVAACQAAPGTSSCGAWSSLAAARQDRARWRRFGTVAACSGVADLAV